MDGQVCWDDIVLFSKAWSGAENSFDQDFICLVMLQEFGAAVSLQCSHL